MRYSRNIALIDRLFNGTPTHNFDAQNGAIKE